MPFEESTTTKTSNATHRPPVAIGTGLVALDVIVRADGVVPQQHRAGGTCGNVLAILAYLGWSTYPVTRLRPGAAADEIRADLTLWNVKTDFLAKKRDGSTPIIVQRIETGRDGRPHHRFLWTCPDCHMVLPGYKPVLAEYARHVVGRLPTTQVFFFDRASRSALILAKSCAASGAVVVFEPSGIGDPRLFGEAVNACHVLKYSRDRISHIETVKGGQRPMLEIETLGEEGLRFRSNLDSVATKSWRHLPPFPVRRLRDSAGAGDWCTAGVLSRLAPAGLAGLRSARGERLVEALRYGQALATWNCEYEGPRGGMYNASREEFVRTVQSIQDGEPLSDSVADDVHRRSLRSVCPSCRRAGKTVTSGAGRGPSPARSARHVRVGR
jgi:fructokinase